jgi:hypothetical protein
VEQPPDKMVFQIFSNNPDVVTKINIIFQINQITEKLENVLKKGLFIETLGRNSLCSKFKILYFKQKI